jgi:ribonuclease/clavin/mitogillin
MLKWKRVAENFISIHVGKEYNGEPYYWTSFYYYKGLIVDAGCPHTAEESANFVAKKKLDVKAVLLTHYHEDHIGGAYLLKERFDIDVFAPRQSLEILASPPEVPAYRQIVWGQPKPIKANPLKKEMELDRVTVSTFETPGHSFDHVSFLAENTMFMGDLVTNPTPVIAKKEEDCIDLIDSLKTIMNLDFETAYGGHGFWDRNGVKTTLKNLVKLKKKIDALWSTGLSIEQIVEKIFSNVPEKVVWMEEMSEHDWSRKNLVESLLGMRHKPSPSTPFRR